MRHKAACRSRVLLPVLMLAAMLAACGRSATVTAVCPDSRIIHGLDRVAQGSGAQATRANLENIDGLCTYQDEVLRLDMTVDIVTDAPAGTTIPYFVVIADPAGEVLDKVGFTATVPEDVDSRPVRLREQLQQEITGVAAGSSSSYTILFGLELPAGTALEQRSLR